MADSFQEREKAFEAKFKLDAELRFKAESRRNKLLGQWAAERLGLDDDAIEAYAKEVIRVELTEPGIEDVVTKVLADFEKHGVDIDADAIRVEIARLDTVAMQQLTEEYPEPLGPDHGRTGG